MPALARRFAAAGLIGTATAVAQAPDSGLTLRENTQAYEINARNAADIAAALRLHGLIAATESGYRSSYVWQLSWVLTPQQDAQGCRVKDLAVKLTSISSEPHWAAPAGTPAALTADWARYLAALRAFQGKHRALTVSKAQGLKARVAKLQAKTCESLQHGVDFIGQQWIEDIRKASDDYDRTTRHGETDGLRWPPPKAPPAAAPARKP